MCWSNFGGKIPPNLDAPPIALFIARSNPLRKFEKLSLQFMRMRMASFKL